MTIEEQFKDAADEMLESNLSHLHEQLDYAVAVIGLVGDAVHTGKDAGFITDAIDAAKELLQ